MNICADILQGTENDPHFLGNVITCFESWFYQYDPEIRRKSMHWKRPRSPPPPPPKARKSKLNFKAIMINFFDIQGIVRIDWVPEGQTVN
jgi:hypothetical protein